jgi:hypothetical protein
LLAIAVLLPVCLWLGGSPLGGPPAPHATIGSAVRALWLTQAIVIALVAPRSVGSRWSETGAELLVFAAVPLPLVCVAWLAGAAGAGALACGVGAIVAWGALVVACTAALRRIPGDAEATRLVLAALEVGLALLIWRSREVWLPWIGI